MNFLKRITKRQWILIAYLPIHLLWYMILEQVNVNDYTVIYCTFDDFVPFCEWLILPYLLWFPYMVGAGTYFLVKDKRAFERYLLSLFIGFFCCTTIVSLFPTGQELRPYVAGDENIAAWVVRFIYDFDTNTNVFPSMHVVGAVSVAWNVHRCESLRNKKTPRICSWILCILIIAATVCLKQHSVMDIFGGILLEAPILALVFKGGPSRVLDRLTGTTIDD